MKRTGVCFILFAALFLLTTCGIPIIYVPSSSDVKITTVDEENGTFTVNISDITKNELTSTSPLLYFFYTISDQSSDQDSGFSSAISKYNSDYASETDGQPIPSEFTSDQPIVKYTSSSGNVYGLYQFSKLVSYDISGSSERTLQFELDKSTNLINLLDENGNTIQSGITRFNGKSFSVDDIKSSHDEIAVSNPSGTYYVKVYSVVSCQFSYYTNTYNTKLYRTTPVYSFSFSL